MKKLLAVLVALFTSQARSDDSRLGSNDDPIRQLLFGSQSLAEQVKHMDLSGDEGPFHDIYKAYELKKEGDTKEAIALLQNILEESDLETRITLWTWSGLRELGHPPDERDAYEIIGAIIEMPSGDGVDTLAAYVDGTARYLNFSGRAIFWDQESKEIKDLCQAMIDSTIPDSNRAKPRLSLDLPKRHPQVTLLTRSGAFVNTSPSDAVANSGAALMMELMKRVEENES